MKINFKLLLVTVLTACAMCAFTFYPFMCTDLHLKIYFTQDSAYTDCTLYYTTADAPNMSNSQKVDAILTEGKADLILPKELCSKLTGLRLDFKHTDKLICINRVELCSGGFVRKTYDASQFFAEDNVVNTNQISALQNTTLVTYIGTNGNDPYLLLSPEMVHQFNLAFSHYTGSKAFLCIFIVVTIVLARKKLYTL